MKPAEHCAVQRDHRSDRRHKIGASATIELALTKFWTSNSISVRSLKLIGRFSKPRSKSTNELQNSSDNDDGDDVPTNDGDDDGDDVDVG